MERENLTAERIQEFTCSPVKQQSFLWDKSMQRLAVRATAGGVKAFIFEGKLDRSTIRKTIGKTDVWTVQDARKEARRLQTVIDRGIDPRVQERAQKAEKAAKVASVEANRKYTLKALLKTYTDHLSAQGKVKSANDARSVIKCHLLEVNPSLSHKPANSITSDEIADLIRCVHEKGKKRTPGILRSTLSAAYNCGKKARFSTELPTTFKKFNIIQNPTDVIPPIAVNAGNRTLKKNELKNYMESLGDDTIDLALKLALYSGGQRMVQILRAEVMDWTPETRTLRLFDPKGKRKQPREHLLPLGPIAASIVSKLIERARDLDTTFLFPSSTLKTHIHNSIPGPRVTTIASTMGGEPFDLRDIRRTVETMLAGLGISLDIRSQLLSHGISGVQAMHYDRYTYTKEKHATLIKWENYLQFRTKKTK